MNNVLLYSVHTVRCFRNLRIKIFTLLGNNYQLKMRFVDHIFDDFVVDHFTLRIILPEGSKYVCSIFSMLYFSFKRM
jgi:hypothetical protein